ncbi:TonB-dependent receptor [Flavobacterium jejuense]|uniref:TonB-dependent receptor n=1 Tax=Flavobacterium jejuense TaxID=1544455 RepID=A0ABX0IUX7_9FLAO|nr:TonB-dependent receptor [Flavobacterium jejuense]NHN26629.1 TonB-dependent receptor [Flavobacterium jejuense]
MKTLFKKQFQNIGTNYKAKSIKKICLSLFSICYSLFSFSQEAKKDSTKVTQLKEVVLSSVRAKEKDPITFTNVSKEEIAKRNLGQDIPILLNYQPSVVTTTDAGNGVGYTYMRVRGSDGSRINVTLNGVPFNDSESHGTFFVNLPDFASSLESVQLQRGVGTSTNGAGAFGASLNMETKSYQEKSHAEIANSVGSFGTRKHTLSFGTGLHNNFEINGRVSQIASDGYIDRASTNMFGYFLNANYVKENTLIKFIAFGGKEKTYQAWNGLDQAPLDILGLDSNMLANNPTYNVIGIQTDDNGNIEGFYDNETDNYWQNHFQLHWSEKWNSKWSSNVALHYTIGKGFFEQYVDDYYYSNVLFSDNSSFDFLGLQPIVVNGQTITSMDYVRRRWLDNDFFGGTFVLNYNSQKTDFQFGGAANRYLGKHYGEVISSQYQIPENYRYYDNFGNKDDINVYGKVSHEIVDKLNVFADLQYRLVYYQANSVKFDAVNDTFRFFNPKVGLNYQLNTANMFYGYFGIANKEPRRDDYENETAKPERLYDFELGWKYNTKNIKVNTNAFYMDYKDQLVLTGALNDVGAPVFTNSGKSYRLGLEIDAQIQVVDKLYFQPNVTISQNKNKDFFFQRDGELQNLRDTNIAFSPNVIAGGNITYLPVKGLQVTLLSKYVGKQYMGNIDAEKSVLEAYFSNDFNVNYEWKINKGIKSIVFSGLVNNIFNVKYISNGYFYTYDDDFSNPPAVTTIEGAGFYPQAGINFLAGINLNF